MAHSTASPRRLRKGHDSRISVLRVIALFAIIGAVIAPISAIASEPGQGALTVIEPDGKTGRICPLERTAVQAELSGFVARVTVTQVFHNPSDKKIEAVYTFPLSADGAVDDMLMKVGDRTVRGEIKRREEARQIYERAKQQGHTASLLDQERPNIFTQSVANILPGEKIQITIKYAEILPYDDGAFKFVFPMVVGPRFIPGTPTGAQGTGWSPDTTAVPDASRITPPVTPEGTRAGHDISIAVKIHAGVPILGIDSKLHEIDVIKREENSADVTLKNKTEIPNKDFVLQYTVGGDKVKSGVLTHKEGEEGYVTVIMIPPKRPTPEQIAPREMIFVIDCSGSQSGKPLEQAKAAMKFFIDKMSPNDTFNVVDFNQGSRLLFSEPKPNTAEYREKALKYMAGLQAQGGTWMGPAVEQITKIPAPDNRLRIVSFMTDGYVGNDFEIISLVQRLRGKSRWFPFGTGNSVNRFLLDQMARVGGGEVEYILLNSPGEEVAKKFYERIDAPVLTDITMSAAGVKLDEVFPTEISDLWARKPLIFKARYTKGGAGSITIKGRTGGKAYEETLTLNLPEAESANEAIPSIWARAKVDFLMGKEWFEIQQGKPSEKVKEEIIKVALAHRIMTQYTSFVAVEDRRNTGTDQPVTVPVPVEMPEGVSYEGVFGAPRTMGFASPPASPAPHPAKMRVDAFTGRKEARGAHVKGEAMRTGEQLAGVSMQSSPDAPASSEGKMKDESKGARLEEADTSLRKNGTAARESVVDKKQAASKIAPELAKVMETLKASPRQLEDVTLAGKVKITKGRVKVSVKVSTLNDEVKKALEGAGLKIERVDESKLEVIGDISISDIEKLVLLKEVTTIEPAVSASN